MKKLFCLLTIVLIPYYFYAQVTEEWVARYEGPGGNYDEAYSIAIDESGNVYVTGQSEQSPGNYDCVTIRYDPFGTEKWVQRYNGTQNDNDFGISVAVDASGHAYVLAESHSAYVTFKYSTVVGTEMWKRIYPECNSPAALALDNFDNIIVTGGGYAGGISGNDFTTIKYNYLGNLIWIERYGGPDSLSDAAYAIKVDNAGNIYVTGSSGDYLNESDYATVKYNTDGVLQWVQRYNGPAGLIDIAHSIDVDDSGNVYVTGESENHYDHNDYATIKYNSDGVQQWVNRYSAGEDNVAYAIVVDALRNVYVTGESEGIGTTLDYVTIKYSTTGDQMWVSRYNGPDSSLDAAYSLALDGSGNVYVTGASTNDGYEDCVTVKYNSIGSEMWVQRYNGPGNAQDRGRAIAVDGSGNVYVTGGSYGSGTKTDYVTIKYSQPTGVETTSNIIPDEFKLFQNYPNPFNPSTKISWQLLISGQVTLKIFNSLGEEIKTLVNEYQKTGLHSTLFIENSSLPSGVYFYQLRAGSFIQTKKMMLLR